MFSIRAEQAVLGAMMMDRNVITKCTTLLLSVDFYLSNHRSIFAAIRDLHGQDSVVDMITVAENLRSQNHLEALGGPGYLTECIESCECAANVETHARIVKEHSVKRQLLKQMRGLVEQIPSGQPLSALASEVERVNADLQQEPLLNAAVVTTFSAPELMDVPTEEIVFVVPKLLAKGAYLFAGKPKIGKSWLFLAAALAVATGEPFLGYSPVSAGDVLYLALEDTKHRLKVRLKKLLNGAGPPPNLYLDTEWPRADQGGLRQLEQWLKTHPKTQLVIIDTLQKFRPLQTNRNIYAGDYEAIGALKQIADRHNVAIVVIHHIRKMATSDPVEAVSGTTGLTGAADGIWVLTKDRARADAVLHVTGRDIEDQEIALQWDGATARWRELGAAADYRMSDERQQIKQLLKDTGHPMTPKEVAAQTGRSEPSTRKLLATMARSGDIKWIGKGRYACNGSHTTRFSVNNGNFGNSGSNIGLKGDSTSQCDDVISEQPGHFHSPDGLNPRPADRPDLRLA